MGSARTTIQGLSRFWRTGKGGRQDQTGAPERPAGPLVWLHAGRDSDAPVMSDLVARLADQFPDLWFLITNDGTSPPDLSDQCFTQTLPDENSPDLAQFMAKWKPDVLGWLGGDLRPKLLLQAAAHQVPMFLFDTGGIIVTSRKWGLRTNPKGPALRAFRKIVVGDERAATDLRHAGAVDEQIQTLGVLELAQTIVPCNEAEHNAMVQTLSTRPVWLAAGIDPKEYAPVIEAHRRVARRSHRLLLILAPANPDDGAMLAEMVTQAGIIAGRRSEGEEPESEAQVYIADTEDELGLWYRLSPLTFTGGTLVKKGVPARNPFDAASLGSVVLHGPETMPHADAYHRLGRVGASREVSSAAELAIIVESLLAPDRVAQMAHAAWLVSSAGAEVAEHAVELIASRLATSGARP